MRTEPKVVDGTITLREKVFAVNASKGIDVTRRPFLFLFPREDQKIIAWHEIDMEPMDLANYRLKDRPPISPKIAGSIVRAKRVKEYIEGGTSNWIAIIALVLGIIIGAGIMYAARG
jgi:hypothetical protein